ncbi:hypothetical protein ACLB2K_013450 [Fragaria x ananassa]
MTAEFLNPEALARQHLKNTGQTLARLSSGHISGEIATDNIYSKQYPKCSLPEHSHCRPHNPLRCKGLTIELVNQRFSIEMMTGGSGVEKFVSQEQFADTSEKLSASITANAACVKALQDSMESTFAKLWEKAGDQAEQIAHVVETTQKLNMFFVDKYLRKIDVEYDVANPQPEGTSSAKVPTMKPAGTIVVKVIPPNNEVDGGNQFEQVNEPIVQAGAQPLAANVVPQPAVRLEDIQGIYDHALQQLRTKFRTELRDPGVNLTYQTPYPDYVVGTDWPQKYMNIRFTPFSREGSEDAATHILRFQSECGPYGNDPLLKLRVFDSFLAGSALTWYTKLVPRSIPDWATMERMFRTTFGTVEQEVDFSSLTSIEFLKRFKVQHAKCRSPVSEEDVVRIAIKGLEPRQRLKHHDK